MSSLWYAAHAVYTIEASDRRQRVFTVTENVLLVQANTVSQARVRAHRMAKRDTVVDDSMTLDGKRALQRFLGIRKVVQCGASPFDKKSRDGLVREIKSGTEASYLVYRVEGRRALRRLMAGKELDVTFE